MVAQEHRIEDNMIFSASEDGEIAIFTPNTAGEFALYRSLHAHKLNPQAIVLALVYSRNKHLLVVGTNIGELYFVDIDKNRVICSCQTSVGEVQALIPLVDSPLILCFSKKAEIFGVYLPPHANKFKSACHLICEMKERGGRKDNSEKQPSIETVAVSKNGCYIGN